MECPRGTFRWGHVLHRGRLLICAGRRCIVLSCGGRGLAALRRVARERLLDRSARRGHWRSAQRGEGYLGLLHRRRVVNRVDRTATAACCVYAKAKLATLRSRRRGTHDDADATTYLYGRWRRMRCYSESTSWF